MQFLTQFLNQLFIKKTCKKIGVDEFGNSYFLNKKGKRFVVYNGIAEASKVPAEWFGWLHYQTSVPPIKINTQKFSWQKIHLPNLTGTKNSYSPRNSTVKKTNSTYEAWAPNN